MALAANQQPILTLPSEKSVMERSILIKNMLEDLGEAAFDEIVPIPNVSLAP
jgi:S-phase kinase-associated protein 1